MVEFMSLANPVPSGTPLNNGLTRGPVGYGLDRAIGRREVQLHNVSTDGGTVVAEWTGRYTGTGLPGLEIKANDVKCSHGATTGRIDESELFYFLARGIPRNKAQELMIFGYFEEIIEKLDNEELANYVRELVQHKFTV